ncbi:MAG: primosomal protein N' (replication factor Y) (superfamily II helicase), partial [Candidatus Berkelbacteria bacterium Licking1014_96]
IFKDDFKTFAEEELKIREDNNYPPFTTLIRLTYKGNNAKIEAEKLAKLLNKLNQSYNSPNQILGPAPVFIRPAGSSRGAATTRDLKYEIILKGKNPYPLLSLVPDKWKVDVDPVELLK